MALKYGTRVDVMRAEGVLEEFLPKDFRHWVASPGEPSKKCPGPLHWESGECYLTLASFNKNATRPDGLADWCRDCCRYYDTRFKEQKRARQYKSRRKVGELCLERASGHRERVKAFKEAGKWEPDGADEARERLRQYCETGYYDED